MSDSNFNAADFVIGKMLCGDLKNLTYSKCEIPNDVDDPLEYIIQISKQTNGNDGALTPANDEIKKQMMMMKEELTVANDRIKFLEINANIDVSLTPTSFSHNSENVLDEAYSSASSSSDSKLYQSIEALSSPSCSSSTVSSFQDHVTKTTESNPTMAYTKTMDHELTGRCTNEETEEDYQNPVVIPKGVMISCRGPQIASEIESTSPELPEKSLSEETSVDDHIPLVIPKGVMMSCRGLYVASESKPTSPNTNSEIPSGVMVYHRSVIANTSDETQPPQQPCSHTGKHSTTLEAFQDSSLLSSSTTSLALEFDTNCNNTGKHSEEIVESVPDRINSGGPFWGNEAL